MDSEWLIEPTGPDSVEVQVRVGAEAQLTPRLREAIEQLAEAVAEEDEVSGYQADCTLSCGIFSCGLLSAAAATSLQTCPVNVRFSSVKLV